MTQSHRPQTPHGTRVSSATATRSAHMGLLPSRGVHSVNRSSSGVRRLESPYPALLAPGTISHRRSAPTSESYEILMLRPSAPGIIRLDETMPTALGSDVTASRCVMPSPNVCASFADALPARFCRQQHGSIVPEQQTRSLAHGLTLDRSRLHSGKFRHHPNTRHPDPVRLLFLLTTSPTKPTFPRTAPCHLHLRSRLNHSPILVSLSDPRALKPITPPSG